MKVLFIAPYPFDQAPSQRFRFEQYFSYLEDEEIEYRMDSFWSEKGWSVLYSKGHFSDKALQLALGFIRRFILLFSIPFFDRVFIHREMAPVGPPFFEWVVAKVLRKKVIYDFDDAIWKENTSTENRIVKKIKYHQKVESICKWAWKVSCGNSWLGGYAKQFNKRVVIIPTTIDLNYHCLPLEKPQNRSVTIGWTGSHSTGKYLYLLQPVFEKLSKKYDFEILIISNQKPDVVLPNLRFESWARKREVAQLQKMDIGIMPLEDNEWEKGKCGFKALQYMAVGIPAIVSPVGVNTEIVDHGLNGYHCRNDSEWVSQLSKLITDEVLRKKLGDAGREKVEKKYSSEVKKEAFLGLFG